MSYEESMVVDRLGACGLAREGSSGYRKYSQEQEIIG